MLANVHHGGYKVQVHHGGCAVVSRHNAVLCTNCCITAVMNIAVLNVEHRCTPLDTPSTFIAFQWLFFSSDAWTWIVVVNRTSVYPLMWHHIQLTLLDPGQTAVEIINLLQQSLRYMWSSCDVNRHMVYMHYADAVLGVMSHVCTGQSSLFSSRSTWSRTPGPGSALQSHMIHVICCREAQYEAQAVISWNEFHMPVLFIVHLVLLPVGLCRGVPVVYADSQLMCLA